MQVVPPSPAYEEIAGEARDTVADYRIDPDPLRVEYRPADEHPAADPDGDMRYDPMFDTIGVYFPSSFSDRLRRRIGLGTDAPGEAEELLREKTEVGMIKSWLVDEAVGDAADLSGLGDALARGLAGYVPIAASLGLGEPLSGRDWDAAVDIEEYPRQVRDCLALGVADPDRTAEIRERYDRPRLNGTEGGRQEFQAEIDRIVDDHRDELDALVEPLRERSDALERTDLGLVDAAAAVYRVHQDDRSGEEIDPEDIAATGPIPALVRFRQLLSDYREDPGTDAMTAIIHRVAGELEEFTSGRDVPSRERSIRRT